MTDADPIPFARTALVLAAAVAIVSIAIAVTKPAPPPADASAATMTDPTIGLARTIEAHPEDGDAWRMLGLARGEQGDYRGAAAAFARAAQRLPDNADVRSALGEARALAAGDKITPPAADAFHAALALDPDEPRARYYLALAKLQAGDKTRAVADWRAMLATAPANARWRPVVQEALDRATR